ncbi:MAG: hypothetical protein WD448_13150 [Woeseia sp.]
MELIHRWRETALSVGTLFLSTGTLLCCALPILLVSLGFGAAVAGMVGAAPWLVTLSQGKAWMFAGTALLLAAGSGFIFRPGRTCPADPELALGCAAADRWNRGVWWSALGLWAVGSFMAYLWLPLQQMLDSGVF